MEMEEIDLGELFSYFLQKIYIIIIAVLVCLICGLTYTVFLKEPLYKSDVNVIVVSKEKENASALQSEIIANQKLAVHKDDYILIREPDQLYEYMKEIVDIKLGPESRKKVWKEIKGNNNEGTRYIRCLALDVDNQKYIIDVDKMLLRQFDEEELKREDRDFIPYKELLSEELINYRCRKENRYKGR